MTVLVEYIKDNKVQDWLDRCVWGKGPAASFETSLKERQELTKALAG